MSFLVLRAYLTLIQFDLYLARRNFKALHEKVRDYPVREMATRSASVEQVCAAIDIACIWYWKEVLCLQRSAATTCSLKAHGIAAKMVVGARNMPFKAHAWVEVNGRVVNDRPYMREMYSVLDQC